MDVIVLIVVLGIILLGAVGVWKGSRRGSPRDIDSGVPPATEPGEGAAGRLRARLSRSRGALADRLSTVMATGALDGRVYDDVEDLLITADLGVAAAGELVAVVRSTRPRTPDEVRSTLQTELSRLLAGRDRQLRLEGSPAIVLVVGVNGGGKTTSVAKLAGLLKEGGRSVLLGAADTFRAAADEQLQEWAKRVGVEVVAGQPGADPASVAFDAYQAARARKAEVLIVDTAGRLQSKSNLMAELGKVVRVLEREAGGIDEVLLVVDGTTGQNALAQARSFTEVAGVTGIVITKLDGTARGGIAVAIEREMEIPVKFVGIGEGVQDLVPFDPEAFVDALLGS